LATLLIGYDLNRPGQRYGELYDRIKSLGTSWWHHLDSTWIVTNAPSPQQAHDALSRHRDASDELPVVDVTGRRRWGRGFTERASERLQMGRARSRSPLSPRS
jgi:hypothetical protein